MKLPQAALHQHIAVLGKTGAGKSSVMRTLVESLLGEHKPVCIIDPKGDWWGLKSSADGKHAGFPVVIFGGEHADVPINAHSGAHIAELVATGNRPCIIDLGGWMVAERTRFFIDFASALFRTARGMRWLVVDEVHNFAPQGKVLDPQAGQMLHWANRLASEGRGKGLQIIAASQRPQKVHKDFLTSCETLIAMRVIHPLDRGAIKDWIDGCPDAAKGKEVLGSLASMPRGTGWVWSPEIGFGPQQIAFPKFSTYDSFKPSTGEAKLKGWAEVNLEEVKAKLADVVKEAQANDPKLLRARISQLERERAAEKANAPKVLAIDHDAVRAAEKRGRDEGFAAGVQYTTSGIATALAHIKQGVDVLALQLKEAAKPLQVPRAPSARPAPAPRVPEPRAPRRQSDGSAALTAPQQRILDTLKMLEGLRIGQPSRAQLALWCEVSPTSGGYFNNLGALRTAGMLDYPSGGTVALTDAGRAAADAVPPPSVEQMQASLFSKVGASKAAILKALIEIYPKDASRDDLAQMIDVSPTSGGYFNNLGALRTLGVIDYPAPSRVVALPVLFLE